jgi:hypothetical protein
MHLIRNTADLRLLLRAVIDDQDCRIQDEDAEQTVTMERLRLRRLDISGLVIAGALVFRDCEIDVLVLRDCVAEHVLLANCSVRELVAGHFPPGANVALSGGAYRRVTLRDVGAVFVDDVLCQGRLVVSGLRGDVRISGLDAGDLLVTEHLSAHSGVELEMVNLRVKDQIELRDLHLARLDITDCRVADLRFRRLVVDLVVQVRRLYCANQAQMEGLRVCAPVTIAESSLHDGLDMMALTTPDGGSEIVLQVKDTRVNGVLRVSSERANQVVLEDSSLFRIGFPERSPAYEIRGASTIFDVELPLTSLVSARRMRAFVTERFSGDRTAGFAVVRRALGTSQRVREEDVCYYLQRNAELRSLGLLRRVFARLVLAEVLGWGVRILPPVRALAFGIGATAAALYALRQPGGRASLPDTVALSAALWLNVGTGTPQTLLSGVWAAVASGCAAAGTVLITVTVGIVIRRLIR